MRRIISVICVLISVCFSLAGCGKSDELRLMSAKERHFLISEYDEKYNHYEGDIDIGKKASEIRISGSATSGAINLKIIEKNKDGSAVLTYEYKITDALAETIELPKKHSMDWVAVVDFNENTEGFYSIEMYG